MILIIWRITTRQQTLPTNSAMVLVFCVFSVRGDCGVLLEKRVYSVSEHFLVIFSLIITEKSNNVWKR